jgi:LysM repeat protein
MGMYKSKNGKVYNGQFNMGKKMNERLEMYRAWKSMNYGVDPNQVNQANNLNQNTGLNDGNDINVANSVQNNFPDNLRGNSIRSDYRNNGFNLGTNNID